VLNEVLQRVLQALTFKQHPSAESGYYNVLCADGNFRRCKPVLSAWLADCPQYSDLHHRERHVSFWCECPTKKLGDYVPPDKEHPRRDHDWLDKYNSIWLSVPAYHNLTPKNKSYEEVTEWNGKEMNEMSPYLLGVVTQSLRGGSPAQRPIFNPAIQCTRALLEFYMYARYKSHDDATLSYMEDALHRFHTLKDVFLLGRAGKKAKAKANALRTELVKKRNVDEETIADTWTPSKKRHEMNAWRDYISYEIDISKELDADFNFRKIHLMSHWAEQIRRYGALQQYSSEGHQQAHQRNLKDGWNTSNHNLNYLPQVITFHRRILCFEIRELNLQALPQYRENSPAAYNVFPSGADLAAPLSSQSHLQALAQRWENRAATCKVFPSGADLAAPRSSQAYAKPEYMGPQIRRDGKHPDARIKDFRALLNNTQDAMHRAAIYSGKWEFIKHKSRNKTYISDEQPHAMELCIYHRINVQVEGLEVERISQMCRCTGSQSCRGGDRRNDWVWVKQRPGRCYGTLNGCQPWQLQRLFKIMLQNEDGAFVEY
jgi:hypothetical protein